MWCKLGHTLSARHIAMQAADHEVLSQARIWLEAGETCWLATVVKTWGSSPRPVGSLFTCNARGQVAGSLSGGCVEDDLLEKLTSGALARHAPQYFRYGITAEETERFGLPCGGHLDIVVEPLSQATHLEQLRQIDDRLVHRGRVRRTVDVKRGTSSHRRRRSARRSDVRRSCVGVASDVRPALPAVHHRRRHGVEIPGRDGADARLRGHGMRSARKAAHRFRRCRRARRHRHA